MESSLFGNETDSECKDWRFLSVISKQPKINYPTHDSDPQFHMTL